MKISHRLSGGSASAVLLLALAALLGACDAKLGASGGPSGSRPEAASPVAKAVRPAAVGTTAATAAIANPILFVTQVPMPADKFPGRMNTFANHLADLDSVPRGGDLMIRYPDGAVRNLTQEAGFGEIGPQRTKAIAVREPAVHWNGQKAIFSMLIGAAPKQFERPKSHWQLYEITGLAKGQAAVITKVAKQPGYPYNNVSPFYASDGDILFTSDRPRDGQAHLYPQLDEYESTPTITGIFRLDAATGTVSILNHTVSGAFSPTVDSFGRLIFTRWDHLQRDQQAEGQGNPLGAYDLASEAAGSHRLPELGETFPERRDANVSGPYGQVSSHTYNLFAPWQMNQDGTDELTLNHIGRHELFYDAPGILPESFLNDPKLQAGSNNSFFANRTLIRQDNGIFHLREDPLQPGIYYGIYTDEFGRLTTDPIIRMTGAPTLDAEQMTITVASAGSGRFRNPLPMSNGPMVASVHSASQSGVQLRLQHLGTDSSGKFVAGAMLTGAGIHKTLSWFTPDAEDSYSGLLWEIEPVEVVARTPPQATTLAIDPIEKSVLTELQVNEAELRAWLKAKKLALIVTRNQTSRDRNDRAQPFNLQVPGGVKTTATGDAGTGALYNIAHYQILQANQVRGYDNYSGSDGGLRPIAQPMKVPNNPADPGGPAGSVRIANDGSTAAFVPANRALTWQTTDGAGVPIVRERVWVTMQAGEIRTCAGCHGENSLNQAGKPAATQKPQALRDLLLHWLQTKDAIFEQNGAQPRLPPKASAAAVAPVVAYRSKPERTRK
ncbi:hypothetical protein M2650_02500 [Luteimonas sp. SX5]|uniref:Cytochrome c domain-containing protein n=1 Tax=Luteimonas galliterrae TaxID=2940486 RepID=A0ABT0MF71_9GAMM|nr:hypothetical protein [Luteimonas galliterrae]MCL1633517.1 hypothetical protein [Luteimonas galliterrae]